MTKDAEFIDYQGQEVAVSALLHEAFALLNAIGDAGDNRALRVTHTHKLQAHLERLSKLIRPPKTFDQCSAADICGSLDDLADRVEMRGVPREEIDVAWLEIHRTIERATKWITAAGAQLSGEDTPWTPEAQ